MTAALHSGLARPQRRRWAQILLWGVAPVIGLAYQIASEIAAKALAGLPFGAAWARRAAELPSVWSAIGLEIIGLIVWLVVLSEFSLGQAFSISAMSYILVIGVSWVVFHEPASWLQVIGGASILTGIWVIAKDAPPPTSTSSSNEG